MPFSAPRLLSLRLARRTSCAETSRSATSSPEDAVRRADPRPLLGLIYVRWASGDFGTVISRIDILRTVRRGESFSSVPYVRPGGEILLRVSCACSKVENTGQV
ncbi:MAG: DUF2840 domain-containing protein [Rhodospirillales bacterium]|nr:DUF2840 domain-containing protein [Rhodospirillales bacterium]